MNLGKAIRLCRDQKGLKQSDLASKVGLSASYLSMLEQSKRDPGFSTVHSIANALGVPVSILVFLATESNDLTVGDDIAEKLSYAALMLIKDKR